MVTTPESIRDENTGVILNINDDGSINAGLKFDGQIVSSAYPLPVDIVIGTVSATIGTVAVDIYVGDDTTINRNVNGSIANVVITNGVQTRTEIINRNVNGSIASVSVIVT